MAAADPYKYFRIEARELLDGLTQGTLALDRGTGTGSKDTVARVFRLAHTFKGAARVVKQPAMAELAHGIEDLLAPHRDGAMAIPKERVDEVLRLIDEIGAALAALDAAIPARAEKQPAPAAEVVAPVAARADESLETVRVEIEQLDLLLGEVSEAATHLSALRASAASVTRLQQLAAALLRSLGDTRDATLRGPVEELRAGLVAIGRSWDEGLERVETELEEARARASQVRLLPASTIFPVLERATRDAARSLGRSVDLATTGGDVRLDAHVLLAVRDALLHVVRNAVAHGIEGEDERRRAGKPPAGRIELQVERHGRRVQFTCRDDGRGIDPVAVRRAAVGRGLLAEGAAAALSDQDALDLIFAPGVTTRGQVTELAGRGVGLDVVRQTAHRFKGECLARSTPGRETSLLISVPVSLSSVLALFARVGEQVVGIPADAVLRSLRLQDTELTLSSGRASILVEGIAVPFVPLGRLLGGGEARTGQRRWTAIVIRGGGKTVALGADRLLGTGDVLVKPLPRLAGTVALVAGSFLDASGDPQLLLDPRGLLEAAGAAATLTTSAAPPRRAPILVIDDSLTTRMLEQSILEAAGYEVDLATSAEEALDMARRRDYGLFVCDVEMPGMNGFEFVTRTRADATLGKVPAILVTSLSSPADRQRGADAGAAAYIVKGEFDQGRLLGLIRELMG
jgi:two-component system chemotaxis sensor kinase CheA